MLNTSKKILALAICIALISTPANAWTWPWEWNWSVNNVQKELTQNIGTIAASVCAVLFFGMWASAHKNVTNMRKNIAKLQEENETNLQQYKQEQDDIIKETEQKKDIEHTKKLKDADEKAQQDLQDLQKEHAQKQSAQDKEHTKRLEEAAQKAQQELEKLKKEHAKAIEDNPIKLVINVNPEIPPYMTHAGYEKLQKSKEKLSTEIQQLHQQANAGDDKVNHDSFALSRATNTLQLITASEQELVDATRIYEYVEDSFRKIEKAINAFLKANPQNDLRNKDKKNLSQIKQQADSLLAELKKVEENCTRLQVRWGTLAELQKTFEANSSQDKLEKFQVDQAYEYITLDSACADFFSARQLSIYIQQLIDNCSNQDNKSFLSNNEARLNSLRQVDYIFRCEVQKQNYDAFIQKQLAELQQVGSQQRAHDLFNKITISKTVLSDLISHINQLLNPPVRASSADLPTRPRRARGATASNSSSSSSANNSASLTSAGQAKDSANPPMPSRPQPGSCIIS